MAPQSSVVRVLGLAASLCPSCTAVETVGPRSQLAEAREEAVTIKTYPFSEPDKVPVLTRENRWGAGDRLYPYTFFRKYSATPVDRKWNVVTLENPFIEVTILPEVGGKIWGAKDKTTGEEFIYKNHVLEFREVAPRGPWTSGGIEWNFGFMGHTPSAATPVDYLVRNNPDGSVSCVVGNMDLPSRTRWSVEIVVPKDKPYFLTRAFWYNPSPLHQAYYAWMNAAVAVSDDLQYFFPGTSHVGHDYTEPSHPWPIDEKGRDLSWYKNNDFGSYKSYFTVGEYENFFGGYYHGKKVGFGHTAPPSDMPGRKLWIWGLSREGMIWEGLLTDADGQYSEPQAGRLYNQNDHQLFLPHAGDTWEEMWFPYKEIGPLVKVSPEAAMSAAKRGDTLSIGLYGLAGAENDLVVTAGGKEFSRKRVRLERGKPVFHEVNVANAPGPVQIEYGPELRYSTDPAANDLERLMRFHEFDESTTEGLFLSAARRESERNLVPAMAKYLEVLRKDPQHVRSLSRVAELYVRRGEYKTALSHARTAIDVSMYDAEANYVYGLAQRALGKQMDALEAFAWAARSPNFRSSANMQMAEIHFLEKRFELALEHSGRALTFNPYDVDALWLRAVVFRKTGKVDLARRELGAMTAIEPLNHFAPFELSLLDPAQKDAGALEASVRTEIKEETFTEMAVKYQSLGLCDEAAALLARALPSAVASYHLAYLHKDTDRQKSDAFLEKATAASPDFVFPFREETIPVLVWAAERKPEDWKPRYYLALLYWGKGRTEDAKTLFEACEDTGYAPFYISRANFFKKTNTVKARADLEKATALDERSGQAWDQRIRILLDAGALDEALAVAKKASALLPDDASLQVDLARSLIASKQYEKAASVLEPLQILPYEGASKVHALFVQAHVGHALSLIHQGDFAAAIKSLEKSKTYPENLGTGAPYDPDTRMQDYLIALCQEKLGDKAGGEKTRAAIMTYTYAGAEKTRYAYFAGLVLEDAGQAEKAAKLMASAKPDPDILAAIDVLKKQP